MHLTRAGWDLDCMSEPRRIWYLTGCQAKYRPVELCIHWLNLQLEMCSPAEGYSFFTAAWGPPDKVFCRTQTWTRCGLFQPGPVRSG